MPSPRSPWETRREILPIVTLVAASSLLQVLVYDRWISLVDEGLVLTIADQLNHGGLPYRDAVHLVWPGVFYLTAGLFRIFEPSILVTRYFMVAAFTGLVVTSYVLARFIAGRGAALGAALLVVAYRVWVFPHWQMINYASLALLFVLVGVALIAWDLRAPRPTRLLSAGLAVGLAVIFKQPLGVLAWLGIAVFLWLDGRARSRTDPRVEPAPLRRVLVFTMASALIPVATLLAFAWAGSLPEMLRQTLWVPLTEERYWSPKTSGGADPYLPFPSLWPPFARDGAIRGEGFYTYFPSLLLDLFWREIRRSALYQKTIAPELFVRFAYSLPYFVLGILATHAVVRAIVARGRPPSLSGRRRSLLLLSSAGILASLARPCDWLHLMVLYPPSLILLAPLHELLSGHGPSARKRLVDAAGALVVGGALGTSLWLGFATHAFYDAPLAASRAGIRTDADTALVLDDLVRSLSTPDGSRGAPLAALPGHAMLNFLTNRPPASRFLYIMPNKEAPTRDQEVLAGVDQSPGVDVVYALQWTPAIGRMQDYAAELFEAIVDRYRLGRVFSHDPQGLIFAQLEPRDDSPERVLYDFSRHLDEAMFTGSAGESGPASPTLEAWPFERPVVSFPPALGPETARLSFDVDVPRDVRLRFAVAMNPDEWRHFLPASLRFRVRIDGETVFERALNPRRVLADRQWLDGDIPIRRPPSAPGTRKIAFEVSTDNRYGAVPHVAGWSYPRLVLPEAGS